MCTDQPHKLNRALAMRATKIHLKPVGDEDIATLLKRVLMREKVRLPEKTRDAIVKRIAQAAHGVPREAVSILDSVCTTIAGGGKPSDALREGLQSSPIAETFETATKFIAACLAGDEAGAVAAVNACASGDGVLELVSRMLPALIYGATGGKPKDGLGWAALRAVGSKHKLDDLLHFNARVLAALDMRVRTYLIPSENLLLNLARHP
jgi:DNA polymerase III gamma/tau subunit